MHNVRSPFPILTSMKNMESEDFDIPNVEDVISTSGCEDLALTAVTVKEDLSRDELIDVKPDNTLETVLVNSNETVPLHDMEKRAESVYDVGTPFLFVGIKMEMPDDYENEAPCENLDTQYSSEEYSTIHEREYKGHGECSEGLSAMILNNSSYVHVKQESVENIESESELPKNDELSTGIDTNCTFDSRSEEQGCDTGHSREKFIIGMECQEHPFLQVKEEDRHNDNQITVNRKNPAFGRNLGAFNSEEEKEMNKTLHEAATELNPDNSCNPSEGESFSCNVPHPIFDENESREPLSQSDESENPLSCFICKKLFGERSKLKKHLRYHAAQKSHSCQFCNVRCSYKKDMVRHMRTHTGEKPFTCDICQKSFSLKSAMKIHRLIHTGEKRFSCNICYKLHSTKSHLDIHLLTHTCETRCTCNICQKSFPTKSDLRAHMRIHTSEKPFTCHLCEKAFTLHKYLKIHIVTHTGEKPFLCEICHKPFASKLYLNKHVRTHSGEKPFLCDICHKSFVRRDKLKLHIRIHSREQPIKCNFCPSSFSRKTAFNRHLLSHTKDKAVSL